MVCRGLILSGLLVLLAGCGGGGDGEHWEVTSSGLKYQDPVKGDGPEAKVGDKVKVHYTGKLAENGRQFDSSVGREPFELRIGFDAVIKGWTEGLQGMKKGGKRRLYIPARLGYGQTGSPPQIPPNADLIFDIEMLDIGK